MARPRKAFTDQLEKWLEQATEEEIFDALRMVRMYLRFRSLNINLRIDRSPAKPAEELSGE